MNLKAVVFDFDGTLLDTESCILKAQQMLHEELGLDYDAQRWEADIGSASHSAWAAELALATSQDVTANEVRHRRSALSLQFSDELDLMPGMSALISEYRSADLGVAIATNSTRRWVFHHLDRLGINDCFDVVFTREDVPHPKPAPDMFAEAAAALGALPSEALAIEDSPSGASAAVSAGLRCAVLASKYFESSEYPAGARLIDGPAALHLEELARHWNQWSSP